jgi:hypothetical protein
MRLHGLSPLRGRHHSPSTNSAAQPSISALANNRFSLLFSASRLQRRFASEIFLPPNFDFQR